MIRCRVLSPVLLALAALTPAAPAAGPFRYPEGRHGKGELRYVNGLPVLTVEGTPEEMGAQVGILAVRPARQVPALLRRYLKTQGLEGAWPWLVRAGNALVERFPPAYRRELDAMARASGLDRDQFVVANTVIDFLKVAGCSALAVGPGRSATGGPLLGRNWDFHPLGTLHEYSLVVVYRPRGRHAFATVTLPGLLAGGSFLNDAGLCLATDEVDSAADHSARFNPAGTPWMVGVRRLLEECATVADAEKFLRSLRPTRMVLLMACDRRDAAVFERTTKTLAVRRPEGGLCLCTNHFRAQGLATDTTCPRYDALRKAWGRARLGVADVARRMHAANQGEATLQSMVFEPAALRLLLCLV